MRSSSSDSSDIGQAGILVAETVLNKEGRGDLCEGLTLPRGVIAVSLEVYVFGSW